MISSLALFHGENGEGSCLFQGLALISFAVCDKLGEHCKRFSSINWSWIVFLFRLDASRFYWRLSFKISQICPLLLFQILYHHCYWCSLVTDFISFSYPLKRRSLRLISSVRDLVTKRDGMRKAAIENPLLWPNYKGYEDEGSSVL